MSVFTVDHDHDLPTRSLAGFTAANQDPYTNFAASIMLNRFQLAVQGQRHITTALNNLPIFGASDERLAFGWSERSILRTSYVQSQGYEHTCVIIALGGTFHESYAAEVLHHIARVSAGEDDVLPHLKHWKELVRNSNGAFASSDFDLLVEQLIRLDPYSVGPGSNLRSRRCRCPPASMAKGLLAIATLLGDRDKGTKSVTLVGGAIIGWFAAFAEFFYALKVALVSSEGEYLHGHPLDKEPQLVLVYHQDPDLEVHESTPPFTKSKMEVEKDNPAYTKHVHFLPFGGRVMWQSLLPQVFGAAFHHLDHEEAYTLATAVGAAARVLEVGVGKAPEKLLSGHDDLINPSSYGIGLIQNITAWLPDLRKGQGRMERELRREPQAAADTYFDKLCTLQRICHCTICSTDDHEHVSNQPKDGYCLPVILETIVVLGLQVSKLMVARNLFPCREGIQGLYNAQVSKRLEAKTLDPRSPDFFQLIYGNEWNATDACRLQNAVLLFSGRRPAKNIPDTLVGIAHEGVCASVAALEKSDAVKGQVRPDSVGLIRVTSGAINAGGRSFNRVSLEPVVGDDEDEDWAWEGITFEHRSRPLYFR